MKWHTILRTNCQGEQLLASVVAVTSLVTMAPSIQLTWTTRFAETSGFILQRHFLVRGGNENLRNKVDSATKEKELAEHYQAFMQLDRTANPGQV